VAKTARPEVCDIVYVHTPTVVVVGEPFLAVSSLFIFISKKRGERKKESGPDGSER